MVGGTYYVLAGQWSWEVTWVSLVFALGPTAVLFGKHTDKLEADRSKGVKTLPVIIGERNGRRAIAVISAAQYLLACGLVVAGQFSWAGLLILLNLPRLPGLLRALSQPKPEQPPAD
ncbi:MAG: 1,4-dihydroxy-2-naphthoate octaprenyltransferase [Bacteroidia bacterium]|jgi:1,4-dihydroxy-2-naphthoate octaprenyltransferase